MEFYLIFAKILASVLTGFLGHFPVSYIMRHLGRKYSQESGEERIARWLGFLERSTYAGSWFLGYPQFIALWLGIKTVGNWPEKGRLNLFLVGTLSSLLIAISIFLPIDYFLNNYTDIFNNFTLLTINSIGWEGLSTIATIISAIILATTIIFIKKQADTTGELAIATRRPNVSVGLKLIYKDQGLVGTRLIFNNFSNYFSFVWTKINIKIEDVDRNDLLGNNQYFLGKKPWEIAPQEVVGYKSPFTTSESIEKKTSFLISIYVSSIPKLPDKPEWTDLNSYSFRQPENEWLRDDLGTQFLIIKGGKIVDLVEK